jgi:hypothetical protein
MIATFFILISGIGLYCLLKPPTAYTEQNLRASRIKKLFMSSPFKSKYN